MSQLGPVGIGLSVAFAVFMVVLAVELYYGWCSRRRRRVVEARRARSSSATACSAGTVNWANWTTWLEMARQCVNWTKMRAKKAKNWAELRLHSMFLGRPIASIAAENGCVEARPVPPLEAREESEAEEEDIFKLGGLWGPPRLLFTIAEETKEEMDLEDVRSRACGKGSRRASRASSELEFVPSACSSPFVTPPSSPPFATPFGSPGPLPPTKTFIIDVDSTSSSSTTSFSPPPNRRPLSALFEETSSFSSSSVTSTTATPATISPPPPPPSSASPKRQRRPLGLLFDPPPSPSSALYHYHNRVHPLSPPSYRRINIDGNPILGSFLPKSEPPPVSPSTPPMSSPPRFCLPAPSQPTTPSPFRLSSHISPSKPNGFLVSPKIKPAYLAEV